MLWGRIVSGVIVAALALGGAAALGAAPAQAAESDTIASLVNQARWSNGQAGLIHNPALDSVALTWANHMAQTHTLSHNPSTGSQIPAGWSGWGENIAQGYANAAAVHAGWMASPGHHANIVGNYTDLGVAFIESGGTTWAVEVFAKYAGHVGPPNPAAAAAPAPAPVKAAPAPAQVKAAPVPAPVKAAPAKAAPAPVAAAPKPAAPAAVTPTPVATPTPTRTATRTPTPSPSTARSKATDALAAQQTAYDTDAPTVAPWALGVALVLVLGAGGASWQRLRRGPRS